MQRFFNIFSARFFITSRSLTRVIHALTASLMILTPHVSAAQSEAIPAPVRCLIEPEDMIELSAPVAGVLTEIAVSRGDMIAAGQIVARLDDTLEAFQLSQAESRAASGYALKGREARLAFLQDQAERMRRLVQRKIASDTSYEEAAMEAELALQQLEEARLDRALAEIEVERSRAVLKQKTVVSPIKGVVVERSASIGEYQDGTAPIVTIAALDPLRVEAYVPLDHFAALKVGQSVTILPEAPIGGRHAATLTVIDRVFDAGTGTVGIRMSLPNPDLVLPAGLRCTVEFGAG
tara:strand:+ start:4131 stop:5009 length:879 start_codon:yes stop_codon:yes gene_type:complete